ncbi:MAG: hypothetical protein IPK87_09235 [Planctomycetes bacterium]|nr:hypothetical protein [Planctomycetota bacterium]
MTPEEILCAALIGASALAVATRVLLGARAQPQLPELIDVQPAGRRLHVLARVGRGHISAVGSVTTWRDLDGNEIRDRAAIEWLYAQWLAHKHLTQQGGAEAPPRVW